MATPSPAELALVSQLFNTVDPQKLGIITGDAALNIFSGTNLSSTVLGEIWAIADSDNNGFLTRKNTAVALRLIGHAQKGEKITQALVNKPGPLAHIEGISRPGTSSSPAPAKPASPAGALSLPIFNPQDKTKFLRIFVNSGPANGLLSGDKARDIFLKSKLPFEKLAQIWQIADTQNRGSLDSTDFAIAMYFVQACMSNTNLSLPSNLPHGLYEQAGGKPTSVTSHGTGGSAGLPSSPLANSFTATPRSSQFAGSTTPVLKPQYTGQPLAPQTTPQRTAPPAKPPNVSPFANAVQQPVNLAWDITPQEKVTADGFYQTLDTQNIGYIEGNVAVPFLLQSGLGEDVLAQVWDLADIHKDGKLTQDGFAIAMHLINGKLAGTPIPETLPETLIPPSLRQSKTALKPAPISDIQRDLFELNNSPPESPSFPEAATSSFISPQRTGTLQRQNSGPPPASFPSASVPPFNALQAPVGQGPPARQPSGPSPSFSPAQDLLGDDDEVAAEHATIHANAVEIGNTQNQLSSTQRSLKSTQEERKTLEETVAAQASQLSSLQSQLATARAAYETEKKLLQALQERLASQDADTQKTREELIRGESDLSALRIEKNEVESTLLRDKDEIRELQKKMKETADGIELVKSELEKSKKEARQQKGLLAIAKKQLSTSEAEKEKALKELQEAQAELDHIRKDIVDTETQTSANLADAEASRASVAASRAISPAPAEVAARIHIPDTPDITTPMSVTSGKSTNPFEKLALASPSVQVDPLFRHSSPTLTKEQPEDTDAFRDALSDPFGLNEDSTSANEHVVSNGHAAPAFDAAFSSFSEEPTEVKDLSNGVVTSPTLAEEKFPPIPLAAVSPKKDEPEFVPVQELEHEDSESSEDEFHDAKPFSATQSTPTNPLHATQSSEDPVAPALTNGITNDGNTPSTFDDAFASLNPQAPGESEPAKDPGNSSVHETLLNQSPVVPVLSQIAPSLGTTLFEPAHQSILPPPIIETVLEPTAPATHSGVNAFDEALGKISTPLSKESNMNQFNFESNFDDTFDFSSTKEGPSFPFKPTSGAIPNGSTLEGPSKPPGIDAPTSFAPLPPIQTGNVGFTFDDAFSRTSPKPTVPSEALRNGSNTASFNFDDAFGTDAHRSSKNPADNTPVPFADPGTQTGVRIRTPSPQPVSPPLSPNRTMSSTRSVSPPPRSVSPPLRSASPRGSKLLPGSEEKRHPKLSLRFPFGRKQKDKEKDKTKSKRHQVPPGQPPASADNTLSPINEPSGSLTPAVDDDTEQLKALCSMGFSRTQALTALELHNFDTAKALNSLLGS